MNLVSSYRVFLRWLRCSGAVFAMLSGLLSSASAQVRIDFGRSETATAGDNNLRVGNSAGASVIPGSSFQVLHASSGGGAFTTSPLSLTTTAGAGSGWTVAFSGRVQDTANGEIGTAGSGGDYTGLRNAATTSRFANSATGDGLYLSRSAVLRVTISGLDPAKSYDLSAFSGRDGNGSASDGAIWSLTMGVAESARVWLNGAGTPVANSGQWVDSCGPNEGDLLQWLKLTPSSSGQVEIQVDTRNAAGGLAALNALRLEEAGTGPAEEVDVYLLGGQSNMEGLGTLSELTADQRTPAPNAFYWNGTQFVAMVPGTTVTSTNGNFGPELAFARQITRNGRAAFLIKYGNSGKPLDSGWSDQIWLGDPPAANRTTFYPGQTATDPNQGTLYRNQMLPRFQAGLEAIRASGQTPVIRGLIWMQGEQDSKNAISAGRYAANLRRLRDRLAADLELTAPTDLPLVFGQVLPHDPPEARFTHRDEIRVEMALADQNSGDSKAIPGARMLPTDGIPLLSDNVHYTTAGQWELGTAFADALAELTAQPIHIAFHNSGTTASAMAATAAPAAQGLRVNTQLDTWNNVIAAQSGTIQAPLLDRSGRESGAQLTANPGYVATNALDWAERNKDWVMMDSWVGISGSEAITISNLPPGLGHHFHAVIYGDANVTNRAMNYQIGSSSQTINDLASFRGTFARGSQFAYITDLSGSSVTINGNSASLPRSAVNGISLVPGDPLEITSFQTSDSYIQAGDSVTLSWSVNGADSVTISPQGGVLNGQSIVVSPTQTTTYTITASVGNRTVQSTVRVEVGPKRPNLVVFLVDDMGWQDTSVPFYYDENGVEVTTGFNQRYRTPHMQSLANSGVKLTQAYAAAVCSPSRVSLLTGMSPARHHVTQWTLSPNLDQSGVSANLKSPLTWNVNGVAPSTDTQNSRTWRETSPLPQLLQQAGYRTIHVGKAHFGANGLPGEDPTNLGYDVNVGGHAAGGPGSFLGTANYGAGSIYAVPGLEQYHGTDTFLTEALTLEANKAITQAVGEGRPFFLHMAHYAVHVPLAEDARFSANYPALDATERKYATMVEGMDHSLGQIRAKLQELGVAEDTLIIFYSDNGGLTYAARGTTPSGTGANTHNKPLRAGKGSAYEGGTRVPGIASWAAVNADNFFQQRLPIAAGSRCDRPVIVQDFYPTLLEIAQVPLAHPVDGVSITGYLKNDPTASRPESLLFHYPHVWVQGLVGAGQGYEMHSTLREGDWKVIHFYEGSRWELYNLKDDLGEATNLAASRPELVMSLGRKMIRRLEDENAEYPVNRTTDVEQAPLLPSNSSVDSDGDGLPDISEDVNRNGLIDAGETDPDQEDSDRDGSGDGLEVRVGTSPLNSSQGFTVQLEAASTPGQMQLSWPSLPGTQFEVQHSSTLQDWTVLNASPVAAAPSPSVRTHHTVTLPSQGTSHFYRVRLLP